jgi:hypothetical protein
LLFLFLFRKAWENDFDYLKSSWAFFASRLLAEPMPLPYFHLRASYRLLPLHFGFHGLKELLEILISTTFAAVMT